MRPEQTAYMDLLSDINFCLFNIICPFLCCLTHQPCVWLFGRFSCNLCSTTLTSASMYLRWPHLGFPVLPLSYHIQSLTSWKNDIEKWLILMDVPLATNVPNLTPRMVFGFSNPKQEQSSRRISFTSWSLHHVSADAKEETFAGQVMVWRNAPCRTNLFWLRC